MERALQIKRERDAGRGAQSRSAPASKPKRCPWCEQTLYDHQVVDDIILEHTSMWWPIDCVGIGERYSAGVTDEAAKRRMWAQVPAGY